MSYTGEQKKRAQMGLGWLAERILDAIPTDGWVSAADVADQVGASPHRVALVINSRLLYKYVERRPRSPKRLGLWLYRRLFFMGAQGRKVTET